MRRPYNIYIEQGLWLKFIPHFTPTYNACDSSSHRCTLWIFVNVLSLSIPRKINDNFWSYNYPLHNVQYPIRSHEFYNFSLIFPAKSVCVYCPHSIGLGSIFTSFIRLFCQCLGLYIHAMFLTISIFWNYIIFSGQKVKQAKYDLRLLFDLKGPILTTEFNILIFARLQLCPILGLVWNNQMSFWFCLYHSRIKFEHYV